MRTLLILFTFALAACSTAPSAPAPTFGGTATGHGIVVVGTLATVGAADELTASAYTRLTLLRRNAAVALHDGRIDVKTARDVQANADEARRQLDGALAADSAGHKALMLERLAAANRLIAEGQALLGDAR